MLYIIIHVIASSESIVFVISVYSGIGSNIVNNQVKENLLFELIIIVIMFYNNIGRGPKPQNTKNILQQG